MSELNADVDDDLDSSFNPEQELKQYDDPLVVPPSENKPISQAKIVVSEVEEPTPVTNEMLFGNSAIPGELPAISAEFELMQEHYTKIVDLKELESNLLANESISMEQADVLENYHKGLFTPRTPRASFTKHPSKTNYDYSKEWCRAVIASESANLSTSILSTYSKVRHYSLDTIAHLQCSIMPMILDDVATFKGQYQTLLEKVLANQNLLFIVDKKVVSVLRDSLLDLPIRELQYLGDPNKLNELKQRVETVKKLVGSDSDSIFFHWVSVIDTMPGVMPKIPQSLIEREYLVQNLPALTLNSLLLPYLNDGYTNAFTLINEKLKELYRVFYSLDITSDSNTGKLYDADIVQVSLKTLNQIAIWIQTWSLAQPVILQLINTLDKFDQ